MIYGLISLFRPEATPGCPLQTETGCRAIRFHRRLHTRDPTVNSAGGTAAAMVVRMRDFGLWWFYRFYSLINLHSLLMAVRFVFASWIMRLFHGILVCFACLSEIDLFLCWCHISSVLCKRTQLKHLNFQNKLLGKLLLS